MNAFSNLLVFLSLVAVVAGLWMLAPAAVLVFVGAILFALAKAVAPSEAAE